METEQMGPEPTEMKTYLLLWNSGYYEQLYEDYENWKAEKWPGTKWATGKMTAIPLGSRVFAMRVGEEPKGIFASGKTVSAGFQKEEEPGRTTNFHKVAFDVFVHPDKPLLLLADLLKIKDDRRLWMPMAARSIPDAVATDLERAWSIAVKLAGLTPRPYP